MTLLPPALRASAVEFRLRYLLHGVIYALGFWSPWDRWLDPHAAGPNAHTWGIISVKLYQAGAMNMGAAFSLLLSLGIAFAVAGAAVRTWGAAYLGSGVVKDGAMHAGVLTDGPYRWVRNPLYLGTWLHSFALALLMPVSGAIFTLVAIGLLQVRLIGGEEAFLSRRLGAAYEAYAARVPRLLPSLRPRVVGSGAAPRWGQAFLGEVYMWGVAGSFCFAGWLYNANLLIRCVLVSVGVSLVVRALLPGAPRTSERSVQA